MGGATFKVMYFIMEALNEPEVRVRVPPPVVNSSM